MIHRIFLLSLFIINLFTFPLLAQNPVNCGDNYCDDSMENPTNCPEDCVVCGDGVCVSPYEDSLNCSLDCEEESGYCGDGFIDSTSGESCEENSDCEPNQFCSTSCACEERGPEPCVNFFGAWFSGAGNNLSMEGSYRWHQVDRAYKSIKKTIKDQQEMDCGPYLASVGGYSWGGFSALKLAKKLSNIPDLSLVIQTIDPVATLRDKNSLSSSSPISPGKFPFGNRWSNPKELSAPDSLFTSNIYQRIGLYSEDRQDESTPILQNLSWAFKGSPVKGANFNLDVNTDGHPITYDHVTIATRFTGEEEYTKQVQTMNDIIDDFFRDAHGK